MHQIEISNVKHPRFVPVLQKPGNWRAIEDFLAVL